MGVEGGFVPVRVRPLQSGNEGVYVPPLQLPQSARSWAERPPGQVSLLELGTQPYRARDEAAAILEQPQGPDRSVPRLELLESGDGGGFAVGAPKLPGEEALLVRVQGARTAGMSQEPLDTDELPVPVSPITVPYRDRLREEHRLPGAPIPATLNDELDIISRTVVRPPPPAGPAVAAPGAGSVSPPTYINMQTLSPTKPSRSRPPPYQLQRSPSPAAAAGPPAYSSPENGGGDSSNLVTSILSGLQQLNRPAAGSTQSQPQSQFANPYATGSSNSSSSRPRARISPRTAPSDAGGPPPPSQGSSSNIRQAWN